jgi:hypothetical protein
MMAPRDWHEEDDRLLELKAAGKSLSVIAEELNRTQAAIDSRTNHLKEMKATVVRNGEAD